MRKLILIALLSCLSYGQTYPVNATGLDIPNFEAPSFQQTLTQLFAAMSSFNKTVQSSWDGSKPSVLFGAELTPASNANGMWQAGYYSANVTSYITAASQMGWKVSKFLIHFPLAYLPFWKWEAANNCSTFLGGSPTADQCNKAVWLDADGAHTCMDLQSGHTYYAASTACGTMLTNYRQAIHDLQAAGITVVIQSQAQGRPGSGALTSDVFNLTSYYSTIFTYTGRCGGSDCWTTSTPDVYGNLGYIEARAQNAVNIGLWPNGYRPDYLNVSSEPDTEFGKSGIIELHSTNPGFVTNVQTLQQTIFSAMDTSGVPVDVKRVVGMGNWEAKYSSVLNNELSLTPHPSVIDIHVHIVNNSGTNYLNQYLAEINQIVKYNNDNSTTIGIGGDEQDAYRVGNSEINTQGASSIDSRAWLSFWQPTDNLFIQMQATTAFAYSFTYISFSLPNILYGKLNYDQIGNTQGCIPFTSCSTTTWNSLENTMVTASQTQNPATLTSIGTFLSSVISSGVTKDVVSPTVPGVPTISPGTYNLGYIPYTLSWTASSDAVGVAGYFIFRNGILIGSSTTNGYRDYYGPPVQPSYVIRAFDAAGNLSSLAVTPHSSYVTGNVEFVGKVNLH